VSEVIKFLQQSFSPEGLAASFENRSSVVAKDSNEGPSQEEVLVRLFPVGLQISVDGARPVLLFRDASQGQVLAVNIHPLEAGLALAATNPSANSSAVGSHALVALLLRSLEVKIQKAIFWQVKSGHLYLRIELSGHPHLHDLTVKVSEALSLCLSLQVPLFAKPSVIAAARELLSEHVQVQKLMQANPSAFKNPSAFLM
jgi:bifunctional DNase/RNase